MSKAKLPESLTAAYDWTDAACELDLLRDLPESEVAAYAAESEANSCNEGDGDVTAADIIDLRDWLRAQAGEVES